MSANAAGVEQSHDRTRALIDYANLPAPAEGIVVTLFITVRKVARSRDFYSRVLGGTVVLEENPCIVKLSNSWILMNPGGPPTPDKPDISVVDYEPGNTTSIFLNLRVADIQACYEDWKAKGAEFVTPPIDREAEIRCYMRDPDGYLIEVGQSTGLLHGKLAAKRPEDSPGLTGFWLAVPYPARGEGAGDARQHYVGRVVRLPFPQVALAELEAARALSGSRRLDHAGRAVNAEKTGVRPPARDQLGSGLLAFWRVDQHQHAAGETPDVRQRQLRRVVDLLEQVLV